MISPNWDAFWQSLDLMLLAMPFLFGVLALFALSMVVLSRIQDPPGKSE